MPIYAYRCAACGHSRDILRKISDPVLTTCPECGAEQFQKQVTAAGFQLKGSGWYVTDFRNGSSGGAAAAPSAPASSDGTAAPAASPAPAPAPAPAASEGGSSGGGAASSSASGGGACGGGCACH